MLISRRKKDVALVIVLTGIFLFTASLVHLTDSFAVSSKGNVTAVCETKAAKKGDEVRIKVSTKKMKISTFIASVEYDPTVLKYEGYEGTDGGGSVYLTDVADEQVHFDVAVEKNEREPVIGMYAIGTADKKYAAAKPLITLVFTAKKDADIHYNVSESTAGKDGYTSSDIEHLSDNNDSYSQKAEETDGLTADSTYSAAIDEGQSDRSAGLIAILVILAILAVCTLVVVLKKRRIDSRDNENV